MFYQGEEIYIWYFPKYSGVFMDWIKFEDNLAEFTDDLNKNPTQMVGDQEDKASSNILDKTE